MWLTRKSAFPAFLIGAIFIQQILFFRSVPAISSPLPPSTTIQFIYIDANVGGSSGGHSALKIGNNVYHFQYFPDGLFKLVRERWSYFRYVYNDLENRTLYVAHIQVESRDLEKLKEHLDRYYLIQEAHMMRIKEISNDTTLLSDISCGNFHMTLSGLGLFSIPGPPDKVSVLLRSAIHNTYGVNYLKHAIETLDCQLSKIPLTVPSVIPDDIKEMHYPPPSNSLSRKYAENRLKRGALEVLDRACPLQNVELIDMDQFLRPGDRSGLTQNEKEKLSAYAKRLKASVIQLPLSSRPDWGYPLLLANARYQAVMWSLKRNRILLLDPFSESAKSVSPKTLQEDPGVTAKLADRAWKKYWDIRESAFAESALDERTYNRLEEGAGRFAELEKGRLTGTAIRVAYGRLIPSRPGKAALPPNPNLSQRTVKQALREARLNQKVYNDQLKHCYPYNLIEHNCATELVRNMNAPFQQKGRLETAMGGKILPGEDFGFIPFRLFDLVEDRYRITKVDVLPGYRKRMLLRKMQDEPQNTGIYFRECNTLTSTLYNGTEGDTPFLFFTDDVVWIRPLYGAVNGAYGMITAALGLFTLPVDGGDLSLSGLRGALYSLPEFFFFNIRKGSFNYVAQPAHFEGEPLERSAPAYDRHVSP